MPIQPDHVASQIPDHELPTKPYLALLSKARNGWMPIPPNAIMAIVLDATNPMTIHPLALVKVSTKGLTFKCACGDRECTKVVEARFSRSGLHRVRE